VLELENNLKINIELCMKIIHKSPCIKSFFQRNTYLLVDESKILPEILLVDNVSKKCKILFFLGVCLYTRVTRHYTLHCHMTTNHDAYNCDININIQDAYQHLPVMNNNQSTIIRLTTHPSYTTMVRTSKTHKQR
jgi:hypothetical protein